jgi:hypothetical protein
MLAVIFPYLLFAVLVGSAAILLTSKKLSEKFVAAGILPRQILGVLPILRSVMRMFGGVLVVAGCLKIAMDSGWIDVRLFSKYAFAIGLVILGAILLSLSRTEK